MKKFNYLAKNPNKINKKALPVRLRLIKKFRRKQTKLMRKTVLQWDKIKIYRNNNNKLNKIN